MFIHIPDVRDTHWELVGGEDNKREMKLDYQSVYGIIDQTKMQLETAMKNFTASESSNTADGSVSVTVI